MAWRMQHKTFAGFTIKPDTAKRSRVAITGKGVFHVKSIIAEIGGVTPMADRCPISEVSPRDRFTAMHEVAGTGPLAAALEAAVTQTGRPMRDLTVMGEDSDPYRLDTPANHLVGQWFAAQVERFIAPGKNIHPRGVYYACVAAGDVRKPDGDLFTGTDANASWINEASQLARWLRYVPFERIIDNKNDTPIVRLAPSSDAPFGYAGADGLSACPHCGDNFLDGLDADDIGVSASLADFEPRQPNKLVFFGEKTSLDDGLGPYAAEISADLYLMTGQISDTHLYQIAKNGAADGRPTVVFTFSDCDPAGYWDMPTAIGRKLQALKDLMFPEWEFKVVHAGLSPEQARDRNLPSSPLKEGEKRADIWEATYGIAQIEIDAAATLQPDWLLQMAKDAVAPYRDADLAERVSIAQAEWLEQAQEEIDNQIDGDRLDALKARAAAALDVLREVNADLEVMADEITVPDAPDLPEPDRGALEEAQAKHRDVVLIDSGMDYVEATDLLKAHSEKVARRRAARRS